MAEEKENNMQKSTEYEPTPAECRLLEVLLDPENRNVSKSEICRLAKIDRGTYYKAFGKPGFKKLVGNTGKELAIQYALPTIHAFAKFAQRGSFQHGEALLEMADVYKKVTRQEQTGADGGPIETVTHNYSHLSDTELEFEIKKLEAQNKGLITNGNKSTIKPSGTGNSRKKAVPRTRKKNPGRKK